MKLSCQWLYGYLLWQSWGSCLLHLQKWLPMASLKGVPSNDTQTRRVISMRAMQLAGESFVRGCCQIHEAWREIPIGFQVGLSSGDAAVEICQVDSNLNWLWFQPQSAWWMRTPWVCFDTSAAVEWKGSMLCPDMFNVILYKFIPQYSFNTSLY